MSMTATVKEEIINLLQDQQVHFAAEIKSTIRANHPNEDITEGVFANALRTLTIAGKCNNLDRGAYQINENEKNEQTKFTNDQQSIPYNNLRKNVMRMVKETRSAFNDMIKDFDVAVDDPYLLKYIISVRLAFDNFENEVTKAY